MFDFDEVVDRKGTNCAKWDTIEAKNKPKDVLPMWVADMDFKSPKEIENALVKRIKQGVYGYSFAPDEYFDAVISWMKRRHDFHVDKEWIIPTPGVVTAIKLCVNAYTKENDAIIINKPVYYPFDFSIELNHRRIIENQMVYKDGFYEMDYDAFEKAIVENDVKMFILCNPYNPIGKVWKEDELKQWFSDTFIEDAKAFLNDISVVPEGLIARKYASCMHDITEGGVYGALWEISKASGVGVEVCIEDIPLRQHTIEFCERYDLNPYQLISSGSMLITTDHGRTLVNELEQAGIKATIIGHTTDSRDKVIYRQGKAANLEAPRQDELYKIYSENNRR